MPSFDILSEVDWVELRNAVEQALKEVGTRYDFKGSSAHIEQQDKTLTLCGDSEFQLNQVNDILLQKMAKRGVDVRCLVYGEVETVSGNRVKRQITVQVGVDAELAKRLVRLIKESRLKVQASIQGDSVRVTGPKRDQLQEAIALIRQQITDFPLQCQNFRD